MDQVVGFECVECASHWDVAQIEYVCPKCSGNLDVLYDYDRIAPKMSRDQLAANRDFTMWRYRALLPIADSSVLPPLTAGWTPIYDCKSLASEFGIKQLLIKDDGRNPTGSFKDRPSALAVVKAIESDARVITTASSGNAGVALAGICASVGMASVVFVPAAAPPAKILQLQIYGATVVLVEGSYDDAYDLCLAAGSEFGWYQRSTGYNPFMTEGKKTGALEICEQTKWDVPDKVVVAMGDGCIIGALWKGFREFHRLGLIDRLPKMIGVQSENAPALVEAWRGDGVVRDRPANTIADSINSGMPRDATKALKALRESGGAGVTVSDELILSSIGKLARATGVFAEPAAAAALAGFTKLRESGAIGSGERVLLMITGNGLKDVTAAQKTVHPPIRIRPEMSELAKAMAAAGIEPTSA